MLLASHLQSRAPIVWVTSPEPSRVTEYVAANATGAVYVYNTFEGLLHWMPEHGRWKQAIVETTDPETGELVRGPCFSDELSIMHVYKERAVLVINHAHKKCDNWLPIFSDLHMLHREKALMPDNLDDLTAQFILVSTEVEPPAEISRLAARSGYGVPDPDDMAALVTHITHKLVGEPEEAALTEEEQSLEEDAQRELLAQRTEAAAAEYQERTDKLLGDKRNQLRLVPSARGLSEYEAFQAFTGAIQAKGFLDAEYVDHFKRSLIKAGGILDIRKPTMSLNDIGGLDNAKNLIRQVAQVQENPERIEELGLRVPHRFLMVGVPGTGKSAICEAAAHELGIDLAHFSVSRSMSKWVGQSEQNMRAAFAEAAALTPIALWMDELGRDLSYNGGGDSGTTQRVHGEFLSGIQELPNSTLFMAAANRISELPPEMLRADRFDKIMFVGFPTQEERAEIFKIHLGDQAEGIDVEALAAETQFFTGAEIKGLVAEAKSNSFFNEADFNTNTLLDLIPNQKNRVWLRNHAEIVEMYKRAISEWEFASTAQRAEAGQVIGATGAPEKKKAATGAHTGGFQLSGKAAGSDGW